MFKKQKDDIYRYKLSNVKEFVSTTIDEILKSGVDDKGLSAEEFEKRKNRKNKLNQAQKNCGVGDKGSKEFVKSYIADLLTKKYNIEENNINYIMKFNDFKSLSIEDKFHIILYKYKLEFGFNALKKLIEKYNLAELREINKEKKYIITKCDIENIYEKENIKLTFEDKLEIITQNIYSSYKGLGVVDEIRDMNINGISIGVSGVPEDFIRNAEEMASDLLKNTIDRLPRSYDSVWIYYDGKEIHLECLSFGSYKELERVCSNIYRFNNPGQLSQNQGFILNTMADNSRVVVLRPPFCESWVCFVRKFNVDGELNELIQGQNADVVVEVEEYLVKGCQNISITGQQGAGKTTHLVGLIRVIYPTYTLRIWESFFETHLRSKMPKRNIVTIKETSSISGEKGLDVLKKTNGAVTIIGEAAEDEEVAYIVKVAQVASKFTIFSHHAKKFSDLVMAMRNSLLNTNMFSNERIAEEQVVKVLDFDIHLNSTPEGKRYIERITECIPTIESEYPVDYRRIDNLSEKINSFMDTTLEYFKRMTGGRKYEEINIIEYDLENDVYLIKNPISEERIRNIYNNLLTEDKYRFKKFVEKYFKGGI